MTQILSLYSENTVENKNLIDTIKDNTEQKRMGVSSAINALCNHTYNTISKVKKEDTKEKFSNNKIMSSVRELMAMILKQNPDELLLKSDDEIVSMFIDWVNIQKKQND